MAVLPDPVGPVITVSLPRGKVTFRSERVNRESEVSVSSGVEWVTAVEVAVDVVGEEGSAAAVVGGIAGGVGVEVGVSACLPVFQQNMAFSNPILVLTRGGSAERFRLETHSGTT